MWGLRRRLTRFDPRENRVAFTRAEIFALNERRRSMKDEAVTIHGIMKCQGAAFFEIRALSSDHMASRNLHR